MTWNGPMNQMFDRYALFVSAEFFVDYWKLLAGSSFSASAVSTIQVTGRAAVADFMGDESTYWNIDFSPERHERSLALFLNAVRVLHDRDRTNEEVLRRNFCEDEQEQTNAAFALGFLHRISNDLDFRLEAGISIPDANIVAACLPSAADYDLDTYQVKIDWLRSKSKWDEKIRGLTSDVPEYVALNFANACRKAIVLPSFMDNLTTLLEPEVRFALLKRLSESMERQFPRGSELTVPLVMRSVE